MKKKIIFSLILILSIIIQFFPQNHVNAAEVEILSPSAILIEASTGKVIYENNADEKLRPASVTKIMTLLLTFEAIDSGKISLNDTVTISEHASSMGGSQVFLETNETQSVDTLIKCIAVASGNDAAVAMGEFIAGSEEAFVDMMNNKAIELGMINTNFVNCCGLEAENHLTTARDISIMSRELTTKYPVVFDYTTIWMDSFVHITNRGESVFDLANTNKFLKQYNGATGLKTGYTSIAKYSMSATATRNGIDLIAVVMGSETRDIRNSDACRLLDYGFAKCSIYADENVCDIVGEIPIQNGLSKFASYDTNLKFNFVYVNMENAEIKKDFVILENLKAPIKKGDLLGTVNYYIETEKIGSINIFANCDIDKLTYGHCLKNIFTHLLGN